MAIRKPGIEKKQVLGDVPVVPSIKFAADQLIRKTRKMVEDVHRAYVGIFSFIRLLDSDATPSTQIRIANVDGTLSIYGDPQATAQISLFIRKCLWISDGLVLFQANSGVISLGDVDNFDVFLRATRQGANDYLLEAEIDGGYIALENVTGSQAKVDTHAADTSTHGVATVADAADLTTHEADTSTHGVAEVADAADLTTHEADTSTHGVAEVADAADLTTHEADTSTHGVAKVADDTGKGARVYNDANISIPDSTPTALTFNSEIYDQDTIHDTGSNTSRLTCKTAGKYSIVGHVNFANGGGAIRSVMIKVNGSDVIAWDTSNFLTVPNLSISTLYDLSVNDYVELLVYQDSGGALNVNTAAKYSPQFAMQRISG